MENQYDAIIIGAGPAGTSAAILLASGGWRVALIEKAVFPRRKVCGECVAASNLDLLEALGVGMAVQDKAGPALRRVALNCEDKRLEAAMPWFDNTDHPWGMAVAREYLDTLLLERAKEAGATLFCPWTAAFVRGRPGHMSCIIKKVGGSQSQAMVSTGQAGFNERRPEQAPAGTSRELQASLLIVASGSWGVDNGASERSPIAAHRRRDSDLFAFKANFDSTRLQAGLLPVLSFNGGYGGMVVQASSVTTLAFCMRRDRLMQCRHAMPGRKAAEAAGAYVRDQCSDVDTMLEGSRQRGPWLSAGPLQPGIRLSLHRQPAFLVGNAAGEAHPIIGEGISMAIQSGCLLAEILLDPAAATLSSPAHQRAAHGRYVRAWRLAFARRIQLAALFAHAAMRPGLVKAAIPLMRRYPTLLTRAARWSGKVDCASHWAIRKQP